MPDDSDDGLRDDFGTDITAALNSRAHAESPAEFVTPVADPRRPRTRRRVMVATAVAAVAAAAVTVTVTVGVVATRQHTPSNVGVVATPTSAAPSTVPARSGYRAVSFHGVRVEVPAAWPVVDGMHTASCYGPFVDTPTAFVGPNDNSAPSCPYSPTEANKRRDGVWLTAADPAADPPSSASRLTLASGVVVFEDGTREQSQIKQLWLHGVSVEIGIGPDARIAQTILASVGFTANAPDTPVAQVCTRISADNVMPTPERLATRLVLDSGNATLNPPRPNDRATATAEQVWNAAGLTADYENSRLVLTRYSAALPATQHSDGSLTPEHHDQLLWVVLSAPNSPQIPGCGVWGYHLFDAQTGRDLESAVYSDGP